MNLPLGREFDNRNVKTRNSFNENAVNPLRIVGATLPGNLLTTTKTVERALFYLIGDQLKAGVRRAVQDMEYPTIVGPAMPKRLAEIEKLTKENSELQAKVEEIETGLTDVGVVHTAVQSQKPARKGDTGVYPPV